MKIISIEEYDFSVDRCRLTDYILEFGHDRATYDHYVSISFNYKKSNASFDKPAYSNIPASNTGYLLGGVTSWVVKNNPSDTGYLEYYYSDGTPITVNTYTENGKSVRTTGGGNIVETSYSTGGSAYPQTYQITGYSSIGLLDSALLAAHASVPFGTSLNFMTPSFDSLRSSYFAPVASSIGPHYSEIIQTKIRFGGPFKVGNYFKVTWNIITWTPEYRVWWVEHLAGRPQPYPEPLEKPTLGPLQTSEWIGPGSGPNFDPSRFTPSQFLIPTPPSGHISELINQKAYGYRSAAFGCPPKLNPFIY